MKMVFYCDIGSLSDNFDFSNFSIERKNYVESYRDSKSRKQSYYVWKLLLYAIEKCGFEYNKSQFKKEKSSRKWFNEKGDYYFSLSHSNNVVAVAVSKYLIGVDVEKISEKILKVESRLLSNEDEVSKMTDAERLNFLTKKWTERECLIKIDKETSNFKSFVVNDNLGNDYVLTVSNCEDDVILINATDKFI